MKKYTPSEIEGKWQSVWEKTGIYEVTEDPKRNKIYASPMLPYPSGAGLHVGHVRNYSIADAVARFYRQRGYNVMSNIGWDSFGLPAENFAIKTGTPPAVSTAQNIKNFKHQLQRLGMSYAWDREFDTSDPSYYKWTQWLFKQFFENDLAYQAENLQWWCTKCKTVLANEQVVNGKCWRHDSADDPEVEKRRTKQWFFKITAYADALLEQLDNLDWPESITTQQRNWIGRSVGAEVDFAIDETEEIIKVFTTRPDTIYGATFMVLAPEHELVEKITTSDQQSAVTEYVKSSVRKTDIERMEESKEKTGVFTGAYAINPASKEKIPIWVGDFVLGGYGTGAIMAVPGHDQRDNDFAKKFDLPIIETVEAFTFDTENPPKEAKKNTKRNTVICIIENDDGQFLTLKYNKLDWHAFVMGGVDDGEDLETAARREIEEETGYTDLEFVGRMPFALNSIFYAAHKDVNRDIRVDVLRFKLTSDTKGTEKREAHEDFEPVWVTKSVLPTLHPVGGLEYIVRWIEEGDYVYSGEGRVINSGDYDGLMTDEMREKIVSDLEKANVAKEKVNYKMRDWLISRQRYWGAPIPIIHCEDCGAVSVPDEDLPVKLPEVKDFAPTGNATSVLATVEEWVNTTCPKCNKPAKRETDTLDGYVCSSWYLHRYTDAQNDSMAWDPEKLNYWFPVDFYFGGDHAVAHLLYVRFWNHFFVDQGLVAKESLEPIKKLVFNGYINAEDGSKMSKSKGNVVDPLEVIDSGYGADALRLFELFVGPYDQDVIWNTNGVPGTYRFLQRVWTLVMDYLATTPSEKPDPEKETMVAIMVQKTTKKVTDDLEGLRFNTAIAALMELVNSMNALLKDVPYRDARQAWGDALVALTQMLAPFSPHIAEEMWEQLGKDGSVHVGGWPEWDDELIADDIVTIVVQVNGKVRANIEMPVGTTEEDAIEAAFGADNVNRHIQRDAVKKAIYIQDKLVNLVG